MSDRIVLLKDGKIEQIGSPVDMYEKPNSLYVADFIGEINKLKVWYHIDPKDNYNTSFLEIAFAILNIFL